MAEASLPMPIADLRRWLERTAKHVSQAAGLLPFGERQMDNWLPGGGIQHGQLHEVIEGGRQLSRRLQLCAGESGVTPAAATLAHSK